MALRKLRRSLKPVIWVMTIAFVISIFLIGAGSAIGKQKQPIAMKVNGKKIEIATVERAIYQNLEAQRQYYKENVDEDYVKIATINSAIENELLRQGAKKLHVGVAGKEVNEKYKELVAPIGEKEAELRIKNGMGMTVSAFKKILKKDLVIQKTREKIEDSYNPSEEEIKEEYENKKFTTYKEKSFDDAKEDIAESLKSINKSATYMKWIEEKLASAKIEDVNANYAKFMKKDVVKVGEFAIDNISFYGASNYGINLMGKSKKDAYKETIDQLKAQQGLAMEAKKRGLKVDETLPEAMKAGKLIDELRKDIKAKYELKDEDLMAYFGENSKKYETKESAKLKFVQINVKESDKDIEASKEDAKKILVEAMEEGADFAKLAEKYSEGPTASKGGDLGWFGKGRMVAEFEEAAFKGEKGKVYPEVVKTQFGYHIIKIDDKKRRWIRNKSKSHTCKRKNI